MGKKSRKKRRSGEHRNKYDQFSQSDERLRESSEEFTYEKIESQLDFHREQIRHFFEIEDTIRSFVSHCFYLRMTMIRVVTGKGNHSREWLGKKRPVVKPRVQEFLRRELGFMIESYEEVSDGGAFDIRLKNPDGKKKK